MSNHLIARFTRLPYVQYVLQRVLPYLTMENFRTSRFLDDSHGMTVHELRVVLSHLEHDGYGDYLFLDHDVCGDTCGVYAIDVNTKQKQVAFGNVSYSEENRGEPDEVSA